MKVSIVIPAYNEEALIAGCLARVNEARMAFDAEGVGSELIVCDNNSTDRTGAIASESGARVVFEQTRQIARARNAGARAATGDWLLFIDADSYPKAGLFNDVVRSMRQGNVLAGGSTIHLEGDGWGIRFGEKLWNFISKTSRSMAGSFIFCRTAAFREIGGFNEKLFASEELDLTKRLKKLGRRTGQKIVILTAHPLTTSSRKLHLYSGREYFWFLAKTVLTLGRTLRSPRECHIWYDGRR